MSRNLGTRRTRNRWWLLLLIIPLVGTLYPPFYAKMDPTLAGIPFFYWYQFLWVFISVIVTAVVYFAMSED